MERNLHCQRRMNILPPKGIFNEKGIPFYHLRRYQLKPHHRKRLEECGVKLKSGPFSKEENERIKKMFLDYSGSGMAVANCGLYSCEGKYVLKATIKPNKSYNYNQPHQPLVEQLMINTNWRRYAETNNIDYSRAYEFAGGYSRGMSRDERMKLLVFQDQTNFVPEMSQGLDDRMGQQVITRMLCVFHPAGEYKSKWNAEIEKQFDKLYAEGLPSRDISVLLKRSKIEIDYRINVKRLKEEKPATSNTKLDDGGRQTLYNFVTKWLQRSRCPLKLEEMLPEKNSWNVADFALIQDQEKAMSFLPWYSLTWKMRRTVPVIKECWLKEVKKLRRAAEKCGGNTDKATEMCIPGIPQITAGQYRRALKLFLEQKPVSQSHVDVELLQKRIEEENLTGYCTNGLIEAEFLKLMLSVQIANWNQLFANVLGLKNMNYIDWINVFANYLKGLKADVKQWHYDSKILRELVSRKLKKRLEKEAWTSSSCEIKNSSAINSTMTALIPKTRLKVEEREKEQACDTKIEDDEEANSSHTLQPIINEKKFMCNHDEYVIDKLKNLIESQLFLFEEYRQKKYIKRLIKIMNRSEKVEALQKLVRKMISKMKDEQGRKLNKEYCKILKNLRKMQEAEIDKTITKKELDSRFL